MSLKALVSGWGSLGDEFREDHLKLCVLWYDEVLIEYLTPAMERTFIDGLAKRGDIGQNDVKEITDVILPLTQRFPRSAYDDLQKKLGCRTYPRWGGEIRKLQLSRA